MPRLACVDIPELPLQFMLRAHPEWREIPAAVLTEDRPTAIVLHRNRAAARAGVRRGMRYAEALALTDTLRAAVVEEHDLDAGVELLGHCLLGFSPRVEPCGFERGVFWLDAGGLDYLFPSITTWMEAIRRNIDGIGFRARIAAGFTPGGTLVASRVSRGDGHPISFASPQEERASCLSAPLGALPFAPGVARRLAGLGIRTVQGFLSLPAGGLRIRLGPEAARIHELLAASPSLPLQPMANAAEIVRRHRFDHEVQDRGDLEPPLDEALGAIVSEAERHGACILELVITLTMEDGHVREERIRPSEPTTAFAVLRDLVHLRIESISAADIDRHYGVTELAVSALRRTARDAQIDLISSGGKRDRAAGAKAFALIRAELGNDAVRRARIRPEHPPEKQFCWEIIEELPLPAGPPAAVRRTLVRRIYESPAALPPRSRRVAGCGGPYAISGAWWARPYSREYRFVEVPDGTVLWIFRNTEDGKDDGKWMVQGILR